MSDDESSQDENSNNDNRQSLRGNSRSVDSEQLSEHVEGGKEVNEVRDAPEDGYMMAPSRNNPKQNTDSEGGSDSNNENSDN